MNFKQHYQELITDNNIYALCQSKPSVIGSWTAGLTKQAN